MLLSVLTPTVRLSARVILLYVRLALEDTLELMTLRSVTQPIPKTLTSHVLKVTSLMKVLQDHLLLTSVEQFVKLMNG